MGKQRFICHASNEWNSLETDTKETNILSLSKARLMTEDFIGFVDFIVLSKESLIGFVDLEFTKEDFIASFMDFITALSFVILSTLNIVVVFFPLQNLSVGSLDKYYYYYFYYYYYYYYY